MSIESIKYEINMKMTTREYGNENTPYKIYKYNINNLIYSFVVEFFKE
jgi:hypothetical protein